MGGEGATNVSPRWRLEPISSHVGVFFLICFKLLTFSVNKSHVSLSVMLNLVAHAALYTGCFFTAPTQKSVELVPPYRKMTIKYTGPSQDTKNTGVFPVVKNSVVFCALGRTSVLSIFCVAWVGPVY